MYNFVKKFFFIEKLSLIVYLQVVVLWQGKPRLGLSQFFWYY